MATKRATTPKALINFRAFREERKRHLKPIVVEFAEDVRVELPPNMPATVMLDLMDFQREQESAGGDGDLANLPPDVAMNIMKAIIGNDRLQEVIRDLELDMGELMWLLEQLMVHYMGEVIEAQEGN